jgi:hypothetical protein
VRLKPHSAECCSDARVVLHAAAAEVKAEKDKEKREAKTQGPPPAASSGSATKTVAGDGSEATPQRRVSEDSGWRRAQELPRWSTLGGIAAPKSDPLRAVPSASSVAAAMPGTPVPKPSDSHVDLTYAIMDGQSAF